MLKRRSFLKSVAGIMVGTGLTLFSFAGELKPQKIADTVKRKKPCVYKNRNIYSRRPKEKDHGVYVGCTFHNGLDVRGLDVDIKDSMIIGECNGPITFISDKKTRGKVFNCIFWTKGY